MMVVHSPLMRITTKGECIGTPLRSKKKFMELQEELCYGELKILGIVHSDSVKYEDNKGRYHDVLVLYDSQAEGRGEPINPFTNVVRMKLHGDITIIKLSLIK